MSKSSFTLYLLTASTKLWHPMGCKRTSKCTLLRRVFITEKVKHLLTLYRPHPPPFLLSKAKGSPPHKKVRKNCTLSGALVATARLTYLFSTLYTHWIKLH